jgi:glycosyltransferase involved in cell wall biosynthesis
MNPASPQPPFARLRVLQLFNRYLQPGGEEKSVARIAEDLTSGGHTVTRYWRESAEWKGPAAPPRWRQPFLLWRNASVLEELRRAQASSQADLWLLHNILPVLSLHVYRLARELGVPVVQWLHNYRPISPSGTLCAAGTQLDPDDPWVPWKEALAGSWNGRLLTAWLALGYWRIRRRGDFEAVRAWVAVSEEMKALFLRAGWYPDRLHVARHSWHIQTSSVSEGDEGHFLFLGRMVETKGVRFITDLWRHPALREVPLVMAGQGPLADELRDRTSPNVRWVGHVEGAQKQQLLQTCRAVIFPCTWAEPLSTVAYEAYERGKPVLASNLGGMKEIVVPGRTGDLLKAGDAVSWLRAVTGLDRETARRMGAAGRAWLETNVSPRIWNERFNFIARSALER